jgi:DNA (cytosine-5)-methyltransferase 1
MNERTHLDLFSGIGGFALAAKWNGYRTVGFCDNEPYAQAVLKKHWPKVPCHKDIREVRGELYAGVTLLTGGFPCQPFSVAGKQRGKDDNRYLWPEMCRVIREARPAWLIGENVAGIVNLALDTVCADLEAEGYEVEPIIIPACAVDAPHRRDRVWIIARNLADAVCVSERSAHGSKEWGCVRGRKDEDISQRNEMGSNSSDSRENVADSDRGQLSQREPEGQSVQVSGEGGERVGDVANSQRTGLEGHGRVEGNDKEGREEQGRHFGESGGGGWQPRQWLPEPNVGRVAHGVPNRVAKLRGLGNAIVPQVAAEIIRNINIIMEQP